MAGLLDALLRNESGGRNIANTTQGTSSGQAQGYFQITTGTWNDFGGQKYAPDPLHATYEQQADIASRIPLRRWDESTVALMRATGKPVDPNRTLGENLAANGESLARTSGVDSTPASRGTSIAAAFDNSIAPSPIYPDLQQQPYATDNFSSPVGRRISGDQRRASTPAGPVDGGSDPSAAVLSFASATPEVLQQPPPSATEQSPVGSLAELFKVADIGQAGAIDPVTQRPVLARSRRTYG